MLQCVDIITTDGVGISVWAGGIPEDDRVNDGPLGGSSIDLAYPGSCIQSPEDAVAFAKLRLGDFVEKCFG